MVPLPLTEKFWESCITKPRNVRGSVGAAILTDPAVGFMYVALASTDPGTRLFLAGECERVSAIARTRAAAFSVVARSFRVRTGARFRPAAMRRCRSGSAWDCPVTDPSAFLMRLVSADAGRLAYFYDTIAQLEPARQRFALGLSEPAGADMAIGEAIYRVCAGSDPSWSIVDRPFARMTVDVALRPSAGAPHARRASRRSRHRRLSLSDVRRWRRGPRSGRSRSAAGGTARVDAASLVRLVMVPDWTRRRARLMTVLFAQRVFANLQPADASAALTALRGVSRVETLPFALERIGVRSPAVIAAAVRRSLLFGPPVAGVAAVPVDRQRAEISGFQASLALMERLVYARALDAAAATGLIKRLLDEGQPDPLGYLAHVARWMESDLLARMPGAHTPPAETSDARARHDTRGAGRERRESSRAAAAGPPRRPATAGSDSCALGEHASTGSTLRRQSACGCAPSGRGRAGPRWMMRSISIASARTLREARDGADLTAVRATIVRLADHLGPLESGEGGQAGATADSRPVLSAAAHALEGPNASAGIRIQHARRLADVGATVLGDVLRSIVYACALGDVEGQAFLAGDVSRLHEFGLDEPEASRRRIRTWELPVDVGAGGQPWHLSGSLLAVDLSMSRFALRRALGEMPTRQPTLSGPDRRTLVATMALMNPAYLSDGTRTVLVDAMRRGREVLDAAFAAARLRRGDGAREPASPGGAPSCCRGHARSSQTPSCRWLPGRNWCGSARGSRSPTTSTDGAPPRSQSMAPGGCDFPDQRRPTMWPDGRHPRTCRAVLPISPCDSRKRWPRSACPRPSRARCCERRSSASSTRSGLRIRTTGSRSCGTPTRLPRTQVEDYVYGLTVPDGPLVPADVAVRP